VFRLTLVLAAFAVLFNVLTARSGDVVLGTIPERVPLIDGPITLNAVVFGVISAAAIVTLVLIWSTAGAHVTWAGLVRILPDRVTGAAVAGAAAINLIPQTSAAIADMREACAGRGMTATRARSFAFLISPIIATGLDRSVQLSEVLEARGFGAVPNAAPRSRQWQWVAGWTALMSGLVVGTYAVLARIGWTAASGFALAAIGIGLLWLTREPTTVRRTRYRIDPLGAGDWLVMGAGMIAIAAVTVIGSLASEAVNYSPYPILGVPAFNLAILIPAVLVAMPALVALVADARRA
jgi:energy-coupling factor transport system permease protein